MSSDDDLYRVVPFEPESRDQLTDRQSRLVDEYMIDLNKSRAFQAAGYTCGNPELLANRVNIAFKSLGVIREIERRQQENRIESKVTPLDVMRSNLEFWHGKAEELEDKPENLLLIANARAQSQNVAKQMAPYLHPRLMMLAVKNAPDQRPGDSAKDTPFDLLDSRDLTPQQALDAYTRMCERKPSAPS